MQARFALLYFIAALPAALRPKPQTASSVNETVCSSLLCFRTAPAEEAFGQQRYMCGIMTSGGSDIFAGAYM